MTKKHLLLLYIVFSFSSQAFAQPTSLNENFNSSCPAGDHGPSGWLVYNSIPSTMPLGEWTCDPSYGRDGTAGISCTGYYGSPTSTSHLDTSLLISPELELSGYPGPIYLNFDTKATKIKLGARLDIMVSNGASFDSAGGDSVHIMAARHVFDESDSVDWVTHQADLTAYKFFSHFYIGFRFISATSTASASRWFLDNVHTTTTYLGVNQPSKEAEFISVLGNATTDQINISYQLNNSGIYDIALCDMVGKLIRHEQKNLQAGHNKYALKDLQLSAGMYLVKISNESWSGVARAVVR